MASWVVVQRFFNSLQQLLALHPDFNEGLQPLELQFAVHGLLFILLFIENKQSSHFLFPDSHEKDASIDWPVRSHLCQCCKYPINIT